MCVCVCVCACVHACVHASVCAHMHAHAGVVHRTCDLPSTSLSCPPVTTRQCKRVSTCVMAKPRAVPKCFSCKMHAVCVCVCVRVCVFVCYLHCLECFIVSILERQ